jgi:hypothetical protein
MGVQRVSAAWSPRAGRRGGMFTDGPTAANRRRGAPREHQRLFGVTPSKAGGVARTRTMGRWGGGRGARDSGVGRRRGSSDGRRRRVFGPTAPVWKGEERIS